MTHGHEKFRSFTDHCSTMVDSLYIRQEVWNSNRATIYSENDLLSNHDHFPVGKRLGVQVLLRQVEFELEFSLSSKHNLFVVDKVSRVHAIS